MSTRAERRIQEFQRAINQDLHDDAAQQAANETATNTPAPPQRVVVLDGTRGRLGGDGKATVGAWTEIARFVNKQSKPVTIQSNMGTMMALVANGPPPVYAPLPDDQAVLVKTAPLVTQPAPTCYPRVILRVQTGSGNEGGGQSTGVYFHPAGTPLEVTGTQIFISVQIFSNEVAAFTTLGHGPGDPFELDPTLICAVSISVGHGAPRTELPTKWVQPQYNLSLGGLSLGQSSPTEKVVVGPGRLKQVEGFCAMGAITDIFYLMFFDITGDNPPNGAFPLFTIPMEGGSSPFSWDCVSSSRIFQQGLCAAISSTGDTYTSPGVLTGYVRVDYELFSGLMLPQATNTTLDGASP
jgi:hypothetical protein